MIVEKAEEMVHSVRVRDVKGVGVLPLVWDNPNVVPYVWLNAQYLYASGFGTLPSYGYESKTVYAGGSRPTVYVA